jgi:lipopolysaccharide export system permease protein
MNRLPLYLFRQLTSAFVFASVAVAFVILFTQSFRILSLVIDNSSTLFMFLKLMALSLPTFLPLVLPIGLGVAIVFVYHKLAMDSELVVMRSAGISPMRQAFPALALTVLTLLACYALTLWITPAANRKLVEWQYQVKDGYAVFMSRPGVFNDITEGLTFYAHRRDTKGGLEGILIHDVRQSDKPVTIMADSGQVMTSNDQPQIVIFNGRRQEMDIASGKLSELSFEQYVLDLNALRHTTNTRRPDPREQTTYELLHSTRDPSKYKSDEFLIAEFNQRISSPLLALSYALIGLAAILAGEFNRRGMSRRIFIAATSIIIVQAVFMSVNSMVAKNLWMAIFLVLIPVLVSLLAYLVLINETGLKSIRVQSVKP